MHEFLPILKLGKHLKILFLKIFFAFCKLSQTFAPAAKCRVKSKLISSPESLENVPRQIQPLYRAAIFWFRPRSKVKVGVKDAKTSESFLGGNSAAFVEI